MAVLHGNASKLACQEEPHKALLIYLDIKGTSSERQQHDMPQAS